MAALGFARQLLGSCKPQSVFHISHFQVFQTAIWVSQGFSGFDVIVLGFMEVVLSFAQQHSSFALSRFQSCKPHSWFGINRSKFCKSQSWFYISHSMFCKLQSKLHETRFRPRTTQSRFCRIPSRFRLPNAILRLL